MHKDIAHLEFTMTNMFFFNFALIVEHLNTHQLDAALRQQTSDVFLCKTQNLRGPSLRTVGCVDDESLKAFGKHKSTS